MDPSLYAYIAIAIYIVFALLIYYLNSARRSNSPDPYFGKYLENNITNAREKTIMLTQIKEKENTIKMLENTIADKNKIIELFTKTKESDSVIKKEPEK
jgi:hypothetical protein